MRPPTGTAFLIATPAEACSAAEFVSLDGVNGVGVEAETEYGLGGEELTRLDCLLRGRAYDAKEFSRYEQAYVWSEMHGPWLIRLPDDFVNALCELAASSFHSVAQEWFRLCYAFQANEAPLSWVEATLTQLA